MQTRSFAQNFALLVGVVLIAVGIVGFLVEPSFAVGDSADRGTLLLFDVNGWHNVVHILTGALAVAMAASAASARAYLLGFGAVYALVTVLGFVVGDGGLLLSVIPINTADNLLHLALAAAAIGVGLTSPAGSSRRATATA